tara:strand:+ start:3482 stop:4570 length:1089 start_codon:yes stop_codon:yes gene_type:complete
MKVIQIIDRLEYGGAERVFVDICNLLNDNSIEVTALFTREPGPMSNELNSNIPKISLRRKFKYSIIAMLKLLKVSKDYDIIHVHSRHNLLYTLSVFLIFRFRNYPIIFHDHFGSIDINKTVPFYFKKKWFKNKFFYIGVCEELVDWAVKDVNLDYKRCQNLPNIRIIHKKNKNILPISNNKIKIIRVGNIHPVKNLEFAIYLLYEINKDLHSELTICGSLSDMKYFKKLKNIIKSLSLEDNVIFIHNETDIPSILSNYDLGISCSLSESGPLVLIEYLNSGIPFLTYKTGEVVKQISSRHPEMIMNDFEIHNWKKAFFGILETRDESSLYSLKCTYRDLFSSEQYYNSLMEVYAKAQYTYYN